MGIDYALLRSAMRKHGEIDALDILRDVLTELAENNSCRGLPIKQASGGYRYDCPCGTCILCLAKRWAGENETGGAFTKMGTGGINFNPAPDMVPLEVIDINDNVYDSVQCNGVWDTKYPASIMDSDNVILPRLVGWRVKIL